MGHFFSKSKQKNSEKSKPVLFSKLKRNQITIDNIVSNLVKDHSILTKSVNFDECHFLVRRKSQL